LEAFDDKQLLTGPLQITIPNFHKVSDNLYRGGQPRPHEFAQLRELGVRSVISFRYSSEVMRQERILAAEANLNLFCIPLSYFILPTRREIAKFFSVVDDAKNQPIFLHCLHGSDRTGMMVAMYRIARENWNVDDAYQEMKDCGFHKFSVYQYKFAVYGFAARLKREQRK